MPNTLDKPIGIVAVQEMAPALQSPTSNEAHEAHKEQRHSDGLPSAILATAGSASGAAFVGGIIAGPIGALCGTLIGAGLGWLLNRSRTSN